MGLFTSFNINATGLTAQRYRMDVVAENVANVNTTRTEDGTPYRRKIVTFQEKSGGLSFADTLKKAKGTYLGKGVKVTGTYNDYETDLIKAYDPAHPDADDDGYVYYPNVNIVTEMTDLIDASRAYEANATAFNTSKDIAVKGLEMAD